jgi:hypothetical protein
VAQRFVAAVVVASVAHPFCGRQELCQLLRVVVIAALAGRLRAVAAHHARHKVAISCDTRRGRQRQGYAMPCYARACSCEQLQRAPGRRARGDSTPCALRCAQRAHTALASTAHRCARAGAHVAAPRAPRRPRRRTPRSPPATCRRSTRGCARECRSRVAASASRQNVALTAKTASQPCRQRPSAPAPQQLPPACATEHVASHRAGSLRFLRNGNHPREAQRRRCVPAHLGERPGLVGGAGAVGLRAQGVRARVRAGARGVRRRGAADAEPCGAPLRAHARRHGLYRALRAAHPHLVRPRATMRLYLRITAL